MPSEQSLPLVLSTIYTPAGMPLRFSPTETGAHATVSNAHTISIGNQVFSTIQIQCDTERAEIKSKVGLSFIPFIRFPLMLENAIPIL